MSDVGKVWVVDPTDGKPKQVSGEEAQQGFVAGKLQLPVNSEVSMTADDGTTMIFPASSASKALADGWRFASAQDILRAKAEKQQGQAFAEGALAELTVGGSDAIAQAMGVEGLRERRDTAGGQLGQGTGFAAGLFGPGLVQAAAKAGAKGVAFEAANAALAPVRGLQAAGDAVEAAAGKALASSVESEAARRVIASGLGRGVEGAAFGAGGALSEEALGNPDANAQELLAAMGSGSLLGFGVGGVFGGGLRALGEARSARAYKANREATAKSVGQRLHTPEDFLAANEAATGEKFSEEAAKGIKGKVYDWYRQLASLSGSREDIDIVNSALGQKIQREGRRELESSGRALAGVMDQMADVQQQAGKYAYSGAKREAMAQLMPKGSEGEVVASAGRALEGVRGVLDDIERDAAYMGLGEGSGRAVVGRFRDAIDEAEKRLLKKAGIEAEYTERRMVPVPPRTGDPLRAEFSGAPSSRLPSNETGITRYVPPQEAEQVFVEEVTRRRRGLKDLGDGAYTFKPEFQHDVYDELNRLKQLFDKPSEFGGLLDDTVKRNLQIKFRDAYNGLKNHLEDSAVWGEAGALQRELNQAYSARSAAWEELQNKFKFYETPDRKLKVDRAAVSAHVGSLDRMRGDRAVEAVDAWQAANNQLADVLDKYFTGQALGAEAKGLNKKFSAVRKELSDRVEVWGASNRLREQARQQVGYGGSGVLAGAVLGALGPLGAAGAVIGESILNPGRAALIRANVSGILERVRAHTSARVENLVTGAKRMVPALPNADRMIARTTLEMLDHKSAEARAEAYQKRVDEISRLSDPRTFGDHIAQQTLGLSADVPRHADGMSGVAARALGVLQASVPAPRPGSTGSPWDPEPPKPVPHDRDIRRFAEVDHALQAPIDALLGHAEKGYVPEHVVKAVEQAYPQILESLQIMMVASIGKGKGKKVSAARQRVLQSLMQDTKSRGSQIRSYQAVHHRAAPAPVPPAAPKSSTRRASSYLTPSDRLDSYPNVQP